MKQQNRSPEDIVEVVFEVGSFFEGMTKYHFKVTDTGSILTTSSWTNPESESVLSHFETTEMQLKIYELKTENWKKEYIAPNVLDGTEWKFSIKCDGEEPVYYMGMNAYPSKWDDLLRIFGYVHED